MTHFSPTFGLAIASRMNLDIASIALTQPVGTLSPLFMNFLTGITIKNE